MTGYDKKTLVLENKGAAETTITVELDAAGDGRFAAYRSFKLAPGAKEAFEFPDWINAYWIRTVSSATTNATAQLTYE
jgi:hypothetical protein